MGVKALGVLCIDSLSIPLLHVWTTKTHPPTHLERSTVSSCEEAEPACSESSASTEGGVPWRTVTVVAPFCCWPEPVPPPLMPWPTIVMAVLVG